MAQDHKSRKGLVPDAVDSTATSAAEAMKLAMGGSLASEALKAAGVAGVLGRDVLEAMRLAKHVDVDVLKAELAKGGFAGKAADVDAASQALKAAGLVGSLEGDSLKRLGLAGTLDADILKIAGLGEHHARDLKSAMLGDVASQALAWAGTADLAKETLETARRLYDATGLVSSAGNATGLAAQAAHAGRLPASPTHAPPPKPVPVNSPAALGKILRQAREAMGLTQAAFADAAGVGRRFVSELENGKPTLELGKVMAVCTAAGIDLLAARR